VEDFGDGGAFPEIHVAQFPLNMGRKDRAGSTGKEVVPLSADASGNIRFDSIAQIGHRAGTIVHSRPQDAMGRIVTPDQLVRPDEEKVLETVDKTKKALEAKLDNKIKAGTPTHVASAGQTSFIRYTPANSSALHNSGATQRIIRMVEAPQDPLEPSKFKNVKSAPPPPEPAAPLMHSPPRQASKQERDEWKIPPCISNWQNNKGFAIPLDKRLAADGRGLQESQINPSFGKLAEVLYIAERSARELVAKRNAVQKKLALQDREQKENELRELAQQSRMERAGIVADMEHETTDEREARMQRDGIREQQRLKRETEHRLERRGSKARADAAAATAQERDITEKIALGLAVPKSTEVQYDSRLFNQSHGMDSGFGAEDDYNIYDKTLFGSDREAALYRAPSKDSDMYGDSTSVEKILSTNRFKPDRDFSGVDRSQSTGPRSGPVEFEREAEDPFGLDKFLSDAKAGRKRERSPDRGPRLGVMHATGGGSGKAEEYSRDSKRQKLNFVAGGEVRSLDPERDGGHRDSRDRYRDEDDYDRQDSRSSRDSGRDRDRDRHR
jgi:SNW domain-containing protein 1